MPTASDREEILTVAAGFGIGSSFANAPEAEKKADDEETCGHAGAVFHCGVSLFGLDRLCCRKLQIDYLPGIGHNSLACWSLNC